MTDKRRDPPRTPANISDSSTPPVVKRCMQQSDIKDVRKLDLSQAHQAVAKVVKAELQSEIISSDVLNFRMK